MAAVEWLSWLWFTEMEIRTAKETETKARCLGIEVNDSPVHCWCVRQPASQHDNSGDQKESQVPVAEFRVAWNNKRGTKNSQADFHNPKITNHKNQNHKNQNNKDKET